MQSLTSIYSDIRQGRNVRISPYMVGRDLPKDYPCDPCGAYQPHKIIALVGGNPARIRCSSCGGERNWKEGAVLKPKKTEGEKKAAKLASEQEKAAVKEGKSAAKVAKATMAKEAVKKAGAFSGREKDLSAHSGMVWNGCLGKDARPYSPQEIFGKEEVIFHPKFGQGIVARLNQGKVHVLFQDGEKTLVSKNV